MARIRINGIIVDPLVDGANLQRLATVGGGDDPWKYVLLQADRPLDQPAKRAMEEAGLKILEFVPEQTYLCHSNTGACDFGGRLPFIVFAIAYVADLKIHPALRTPDRRDTATLCDLLAASPLPDAPRELVRIVFHADVDLRTPGHKMVDALGTETRSISVRGNTLKAWIRRADLGPLSALAEVRHIEPNRSNLKTGSTG